MVEKNKQCPFCGEEININETVCPICCETLPVNEISNNNTSTGTSEYSKSNNLTSIIQTCIGLIFLIAILFWIFSETTNNYTPSNWLKGCEEGKEHLGSYGMGVFKEYKCKNKPYTDVVEASMVTLGWNSSYQVFDGDNAIGYISYDHNFRQYNCAYRWDQEERICTLKEFIANLKKYEDYKKDNKNYDNVSRNVEKSSNYENLFAQPKKTIDVKPQPPTAKPIPIQPPNSVENNYTDDNDHWEKRQAMSDEEFENENRKISEQKSQVHSHSSEYNYDSMQDVNTSKQPDFGPYMRDLQRRIKMNWDPPKGNENKKVVVLMKIAKDGRLLSHSIYRSSGVPAADNAALNAVWLTAPFRPLPHEFKGQSIDIQFTFDYNVYDY